MYNTKIHTTQNTYTVLSFSNAAWIVATAHDVLLELADWSRFKEEICLCKSRHAFVSTDSGPCDPTSNSDLSVVSTDGSPCDPTSDSVLSFVSTDSGPCAPTSDLVSAMLFAKPEHIGQTDYAPVNPVFHNSTISSHRAAATWLCVSVCLYVINFCKQHTSKTNLWLFPKFTAPLLTHYTGNN